MLFNVDGWVARPKSRATRDGEHKPFANVRTVLLSPKWDHAECWLGDVIPPWSKPQHARSIGQGTLSVDVSTLSTLMKREELLGKPDTGCEGYSLVFQVI